MLTGLATATFPDGTTPEVGDVVRVATNVFSAGQETTVRLLGTALKVLGDRPDIQQQVREDRSLLPNFIEECAAHREPGQGRLPAVARARSTVGEQATRRGHHGDGDQRRRQPRPAPLRGSRRRSIPTRKNARQHLAFGRGIHSCPGAPLARAETRVGLERLLDRTTDIRISRGASTARRATAATSTFRRTSCAG